MLICSIFFASWLCFPPITIQQYDQEATFTAYNAVPEQTDSTPCITASGHNICDEDVIHRIAASNKYPFGTILDIEGYGRYEVQDRTNKRFSGRIDLLFASEEEAIKFGKKTLKYRIIGD